MIYIICYNCNYVIMCVLCQLFAFCLFQPRDQQCIRGMYKQIHH